MEYQGMRWVSPRLPVFQRWARGFFFVVGLIGVVSSSAFAAPFIENGDGTVTDRGNRLMWQKMDSYQELKKGLNWYDAVVYVENKNTLKFAGHDDWRLPTLEELNQLWDATLPARSKDGEPLGLPREFGDGASYYVWTGTERGLDHAWYFGMGQKENYFNLKDLSDLDQGVRMVRPLKP